MDVPVPDGGTDPVPVQPVQTQSESGLVTLQVTELPELNIRLPAAGLGFPCSEITFNEYWRIAQVHVILES